MSSETEVPVTVAGGSSGVSAGAIDWTTYSFPQPVELTGLPEKFNGGVGFSRWQKRMKLWLTVKGLWPVVEYEKPVVDQDKADSVKGFAKWAEKDGVARAAILAALTNTLFDVYSSDAYSAKLLWEKLDQTHNTDSQGLEKYSVAKFLEFKLVDNKSMTEQVHEFEMIVHALKESGMDLPEKFKVMSVIEKLPKSWEEFSLSLKRQKGEITWTNLMLDISVLLVVSHRATIISPAMDPFISHVDSSNLSIEFWGMIVKPGETRMVSPVVNQPIGLVEVTLKVKDQEIPDHVPVYVTLNGHKFELAALSGSKPEVGCDLVFYLEFGLSHDWEGGNVCFSGYKAVPKKEEATPDKVE